MPKAFNVIKSGTRVEVCPIIGGINSFPVFSVDSSNVEPFESITNSQTFSGDVDDAIVYLNACLHAIEVSREDYGVDRTIKVSIENGVLWKLRKAK
jgi:hypothetical protein